MTAAGQAAIWTLIILIKTVNTRTYAIQRFVRMNNHYQKGMIFELQSSRGKTMEKLTCAFEFSMTPS